MASFEDTIQAMSPDVYWRMDDLDLSVRCTDYSGNGRHGTYQQVPNNLTPGQPSLVPSDAGAKSVFVETAEYAEGHPERYANASDNQNDDWWNAPVISASLCFKKHAGGYVSFDFLARRGVQGVDDAVQYLIYYNGSNGIILRYSVEETPAPIVKTLVYDPGIPNLIGDPHILSIVVDLPGTRQEMWYDGVLVAFSSIGGDLIQPVNNWMTVGQTKEFLTPSLGGDMSHFIFSQRGWTQGEILALHTAWLSGEDEGGGIFPPSTIPGLQVCTKTCPVGLPPTGDSVTCIPKP